MIQSGPSLYPRNRRWKTKRRTTRQKLDQEMPLFDEDWLAEGGGAGAGCVEVRRDAKSTANGRSTAPEAGGLQLADVESAVLSLGGSSVVVRVHPEPESTETTDFETDATATIQCIALSDQLDAASAEVEGAAEREARAARRRSALLEEMEASEVCETSVPNRSGVMRSGCGVDEFWADQFDSFGPSDRGSSHRDRHRPDSASPRANGDCAASVESPRSFSDHRKPEPPFRWRRMWATAFCSGGAGCVALLIGHAVGI